MNTNEASMKWSAVPPSRIAAGLAMAAWLAACGNSDYGPQPGVRSILAVNSKTGSLSHLGPALEKGMQLAVEDINAAGGVLGEPLQLIAADDHSDETAGLTEARFYYERHRDSIVGIAGAALDPVSRGLLKEIADADLRYRQKIPIVSPASASPQFSELIDPSNLFYRTVMSSQNEGEALARKAERLGYRRGVIIALRDTPNERLADTFARAFNASGDDHTVATAFYSSPAQEAVLSAFGKVAAAEPDFLLFVGYGADGKIALSEWAAHYAHLPLLLPSALASDNFFASLDERTLTALEQVAVNGAAPGNDPESEGLAAFTQRFCRRHPGECACPAEKPACDRATEATVPGFVPNAYDAVYLLALAVEQTGRASPQAVVRGPAWNVHAITQNLRASADGQGQRHVLPGRWEDALAALDAGQSLDYQGASAKDLLFDTNGDVRSGYYTYWTVEGGRVRHTNSDGAPESVRVSY